METPTVGLKELSRQARNAFEREAIKDVLDRMHWNRTKAARALQISYKALLNKIKLYGLDIVDPGAE